MQWVEKNETLLAVLGVSSVVFFVGSILAIPLIIALLPVDYFVREPQLFRGLRPDRLILKLLKNLVGIFFVLCGILMLFLPGQGLLSLLFGMSLLDFPAKRRWQLAMVRHPRVHGSINWIRRKAKKPPIELPEPTATERTHP